MNALYVSVSTPPKGCSAEWPSLNNESAAKHLAGPHFLEKRHNLPFGCRGESHSIMWLMVENRFKRELQAIEKELRAVMAGLKSIRVSLFNQTCCLWAHSHECQQFALLPEGRCTWSFDAFLSVHPFLLLVLKLKKKSRQPFSACRMSSLIVGTNYIFLFINTIFVIDVIDEYMEDKKNLISVLWNPPCTAIRTQTLFLFQKCSISCLFFTCILIFVLLTSLSLLNIFIVHCSRTAWWSNTWTGKDFKSK